MKIQQITFAFSIIVFCTLAPALSKDTIRDIEINLLSKRVSMIQLIANPRDFDGKQVFVDGILHYVFEDDTLYLSREMADAGIKTNGLGISFNDKELTLLPAYKVDRAKVNLEYFHNRCVALYGRFGKDGVLTDVTVVRENQVQPLRMPKSPK